MPSNATIKTLGTAWLILVCLTMIAFPDADQAPQMIAVETLLLIGSGFVWQWRDNIQTGYNSVSYWCGRHSIFVFVSALLLGHSLLAAWPFFPEYGTLGDLLAWIGATLGTYAVLSVIAYWIIQGLSVLIKGTRRR